MLLAPLFEKRWSSLYWSSPTVACLCYHVRVNYLRILAGSWGMWFRKEGFRTSWFISFKFHFALSCILMIISGENFSHVPTAELLWHVQNCDMIRSISFTQEQYIFSHDLGDELINWFWNVSQTLTLYMLNFFGGSKNIYLHFMSFLHIDMTQVAEIPP